MSVFFGRSEGPMRVWHAAAQRFARELPRAAEAADGARVRAVHTTERTDVRQLLSCNRHSAQQLHVANMSPVPRSCPRRAKVLARKEVWTNEIFAGALYVKDVSSADVVGCGNAPGVLAATV